VFLRESDCHIQLHSIGFLGGEFNDYVLIGEVLKRKGKDHLGSGDAASFCARFLIISMSNFPVLYLYFPPGTQAHIGPIASQGGAWVGSGLQVYVPNQQCERLRNGSI
jgi:hypothetical protein